MHMQKIYSDYGMNYGWLGKQAVLFVDEVVAADKYDSFYALAKNTYHKAQHELPVKLLKEKKDANAELTSEEEVAEIATKIVNPFLLFVKKGAITKTVNDAVDLIDYKTKTNSLLDQEYTCLILLFYLNDLSKFLELTGD